VISSQDGIVEMESTRYPFCFFGDRKDPNGTASILSYVPFNQELNRLTLVVNNLPKPQAEVTFGSQTKTFSREQLASGINLADEFLENPFAAPFQQVMDAVGKKQAYETSMIKGFVTNFRQLNPTLRNDAEVESALATIRRKMTAIDDAAQAEAKAAVKPVRYQLVIRPKS
jgi:hypothetical protein